MVNSKFKNTIIIFNEYFYNEIDLDSFNRDEILISNGNICDVKISILGDTFKIRIQKVDGYWLLLPSNEVTFVINSTKINRKKLVHGDQITILDSYKNEMFKVNFFLDFSSGKEDYSNEIDISNVSEIKIGKAKDNDIIIEDNLIEDYHCILKKVDNKRIIIDLHSKYNVYVNGSKVIDNSELLDNDFIILCGYKLLYKEEKVFCPRNNISINDSKIKFALKESSRLNYPEFIRTPRMKWKLPTDKVEIVAPPKKDKKPGIDTFLNLIPTLGMSMMVLVMPFGNPMYRVGMLVVTVVTTIIMFVINTVRTSKQIKKRNLMYLELVDKKESEIKELYNKQIDVLQKLYPSMEEACDVIDGFERRLWEKSSKDEDFLDIYLGRGTVPISFEINIPKEEFGEREDELLLKPREIKDKYSKIDNMPISINLKENQGVGIVGKDKYIYNLVKNMIFELSVYHYSEDVNFICLCTEENIEEWKWIRWLPHIWSKNKNIRFMGVGKESCHNILDVINSVVSKREDKKASKMPHYVMIVTDPILLENEAISKYLDMETSLDLGLTTFYVYQDIEFIPKQCSQILEVFEEGKGALVDVLDSGNKQEFVYSNFANEMFDGLARRMGPIYVKKNYSENTLPKKITLYELYKINSARELNIEYRWIQNNVTKSIGAPLGLNASGTLISLDLHEKTHGPHGLVAGTTGSGKSELLQTIISSLAINYSPSDVSFILIDYKGGGMANLFTKLPHLIGTITNLDGNLVNRSLTLIKSELKRRQNIFAEFEVNHINGYKKLEKNNSEMEPLPHLVIIADEFAELKSDQPEFMKELVSTARIGRSLGVHLILATQKPAGVVDSQIWSNSKFKLCLKVQDESDSKEMLKKPDAAFIVEPGRGYFQVGNDEYYDLVQTAWSGAEKYVDDNITSESIDIAEVSIEGIRNVIYSSSMENKDKEKITQLDEIVNYISEFSSYKGYRRCDNCWTEPLAEKINLLDLISVDDIFFNNKDRGYKKVSPIIGEIDYPNMLKKDILRIDFSEQGNVLLVGSSGFGKTTFIQTLACSLIAEYRPNEINMYILDFASRTLKSLNEAPHVGDVIFSDDEERVINLFKMMRKEIEKRKVVFSELGASNLINYIEASGIVIPQILILLDNFAEFKENYDSLNDELLLLMREGQSYGINFVITNSTANGISYKFTNNIKTKMCLTCTDKTDYNAILGLTRVQPTKVKGRAIIGDDNGYEVQFASFGIKEKEFDRLNEIKEFIREVNNKNKYKKAKKVITVPETLYLHEVIENIEDDGEGTVIPIGFNIEALSYIGLKLEEYPNFMIVGNPKSGKTSIIKNIIESQRDKCTEFFIIDNSDEGLIKQSTYNSVRGYSSNKEDGVRLFNEILEEGDKRKEFIKVNGEESLKELPPIVVAIDGLGEFITYFDRKNIDLVEDLIKVLRNYNIITVVTGTEGDFKNSIYSVKFVKALKESGTGILLDYLANQTLFTNVKLKYGVKEREIKAGDGYLILNTKYVAIKGIEYKI